MRHVALRFLAIALAIWAGAACPAPARAETLYDALGGQPGLVRITDDLIRLSLADPRIAQHFEDTNIDRFKALLVEQLCELSGGPCTYRGRDMFKSHADLGITMRGFNVLVEHLQTAMEACGVPFRTQNRLLALLAPMHRDVVTK